jgi:hypothetical protein
MRNLPTSESANAAIMTVEMRKMIRQLAHRFFVVCFVWKCD